MSDFKITEEDLNFMNEIRKYLYKKNEMLFNISYNDEKKLIEDVYRFIIKSLLSSNSVIKDFPIYFKNMFYNEIVNFEYNDLRALYNDYKNIDDVSFITNCFSNSQNPTSTP